MTRPGFGQRGARRRWMPSARCCDSIDVIAHLEASAGF
jgi:hypothetical protein